MLARAAHNKPQTTNHKHHSGFTLTEVLIVIGIIILLIALAIPAFSIFRGERSTEAAENQLSAMLARARTESIGYQKVGGVLLFQDPREPERVSVAQVWQVDTPTGATKEVYLDLVPDRDFLVLPAGVGIQLVDDCEVDAQKKRLDDGYINFNTECHTGATQQTAGIGVGGVILFDANGRLMSVTYGFCLKQALGGPFTALGDLLYYSSNPTPPTNPNPDVLYMDPGLPAVENPPAKLMRSQFAMVAYDRVAFANAFPNAAIRESDQQLQGVVGTQYQNSGEAAEEDWLDSNGVPLVVNRYNGTIARGL